MEMLEAVSETTLFNADCFDVMPEIESESVDMVLTSPPYDNLREYGGVCDPFTFDKFQVLAKELFRVLKWGGVVIWIVNDQTINGSETGTSFRQALYFKEIGFNIHDTMIWYKNSGFPYPCKVRYNPGFEFMFVFSKGKIKTANLIQDRKNKRSGEFINGKGRQTDGSTKQFSGVGRTLIKDIGVRYNVWEISPCKSQTERTGHPAQFPLRLVRDHLKSWSNEGDLILDPFLGSGTTGVACVELKRKFIGIEINPEYFAIAQKRIQTAANNYQFRMFEE